MDTQLATAVVSSGGSVLVALGALWFNSFHISKRMDDMRQDIRDVRSELHDLRSELHTFKEVVNSKFAALDLEIAKFLDRR
jgi:hypothetical protein